MSRFKIRETVILKRCMSLDGKDLSLHPAVKNDIGKKGILCYTPRLEWRFAIEMVESGNRWQVTEKDIDCLRKQLLFNWK